MLEAPILHYPDPSKCYIVNTDASDEACRTLLSQEHDSQELPVAFLSHTFTDTQQKWSTTEQEASGIYYVVTKWNYYLQGSDIVVHSDQKPLQKFLNGKNTNNNVNRLSLELATYNITFEWISGAHNKVDDCLSWLVDVKDTPAASTASIHMLVTNKPDGPATCTHSKTHNPTDTTLPTDASTTDKVNAPPPLREDHKDTLQLMQQTDPFCKSISKRQLSGKAPSHEVDTFTHIKGLFTSLLWTQKILDTSHPQNLVFHSSNCWSSW